MRQVRAILAGLALLALIGGVPLLLTTFVGMPLPTSVPNWSTLASTQVDSTFVIKVFSVAVWLAWAHFVVCVLAETGSVLAQLRGRPRAPLRIPFDLGGQQVARRLVITVLSGLIGAAALGPTAAMAATPAAPGVVSAATTTASTVSAAGSSAASSTGASPSAVRGSTAPARDVAATFSTTSSTTSVAPSTSGTSAAPQTSQLPQYVVAGSTSHHDNLWDIAETHLGDPMRWHEIWTLNQQQTMNDGDVFTHPELIHPGWVLAMPADATGLSAPVTAPATQTPPTSGQQTAPGSTPSSSVAGQEQDDTSHAPEDSLGAESSSPVAAPSASATASAAPTTSAPAETSSATAAPRPSNAAAVPGTQASAAGDEAAAASEVSPEAGLGSGVVNVRTVGGIGALLAAGLMGAVFLRRRRSDVRRRAGYRVPQLDEVLAEVEDDLLNLHTPMSFPAIDRGLRRLSADLAEREQELPGIVTARLDDEGLLLTVFEAVDLPGPWERVDEDGFEWLLSAAVVEPEEHDEAALAPAPWPSLVTLGHDEEDGQILVDLEELLALNIAASSEQESRAMLRALAVELATTPWGPGLQVTLVGCCQELAGIVPERMRYLPDVASLEQELQVRRDDVQRVLDDSGLGDVAHARQAAEAPDVWSPHIILVGQPLHGEEQERICELLNDLPRVGIAAVTTDEEGLGEWSLNVDVADPSWAELSPVATRLRPQRLDSEDYASIVQLLAHADSDPVARTDLAFTTPTVEPRLVRPVPGLSLDIPAVIDLTTFDDAEVGTDRGDADVLGAVLDDPSPKDEEDSNQRTVVSSARAGTPADDRSGEVPAQTRVGEVHADDRALTPEEGDAGLCAAAGRARALELLRGVGFDARLPMLRILGPVDVQRDGEDLAMTGRQIALGIFLALNPGATSRDVIDDFVQQPVAPSNLHPRIAELRKALGKHPDTGAPLMPLNTTAAGYQLGQGVFTDWELVQRLADSDDTDMLEAALSLVRGAPFGRIGSRAAHYYVWVEHAHLERQIRQFVTDVAVTVASRSLEAGQHRRAAAAAAKGLLLESGHEQLRRLEWIALEALGQREELRRSVAELARVNEELGCEEDPDTLSLIDELRAQGALRAA